ncbi:MAG: hypothetical protein DCC75_03480 [Proteobacteria bacterium]|nr:MAG: hypothetical protein DCC75_03480 [Pseudomonadota bacterium]
MEALKNKVVLVSGGSRGIGAAICAKLSELGAKVAINYNRSFKEAADLAASLNGSFTVKGDVSLPEEAQRVVRETLDKYGQIDILVNNAGYYEMQPIEKSDLEHFRRIFDLNVLGVVSLVRAAVPHLKSGARIINISSVAARARFANAGVYSASKAALEALTRCWGQELGPRGILVNCVAPGTTETEMLKTGIDDQTRKHFESNTALGRLGTPSDIADVVAFLAGDQSNWLVGQTIDASGGLNI